MSFLVNVAYEVDTFCAPFAKPRNYFKNPFVVAFTGIMIHAVWGILSHIYQWEAGASPVAFYLLFVALSNGSGTLTGEELAANAPKETEPEPEPETKLVKVATIEEAIEAAEKYVPSGHIEESEEERFIKKLGIGDEYLPQADVPVANAGEFLFELLFRNQETRIISALSVKDAVEKSNLSQRDREDLLGIEQI